MVDLDIEFPMNLYYHTTTTTYIFIRKIDRDECTHFVQNGIEQQGSGEWETFARSMLLCDKTKLCKHELMHIQIHTYPHAYINSMNQTKEGEHRYHHTNLCTDYIVTMCNSISFRIC